MHPQRRFREVSMLGMCLCIEYMYMVNMKQKSEYRSQNIGVRIQESKYRSQKSEVNG